MTGLWSHRIASTFAVICLIEAVVLLAARGQESDDAPADRTSHEASVATVSESAIKGFDRYPEPVKRFLRNAIDLTRKNLSYRYGSADPDKGGMDCSGFVYHLLKEAGMADPPRSSADQYVWARKACTFYAVVGTTLDSFEFSDLKPGDLLFWTGTYNIEREPPLTHSMIYLGKAASDGTLLMIGASEGRTYRGVKQYGVSVFDFKLPKPSGDSKNQRSRFVGYARIPLPQFSGAAASPGQSNATPAR